MEIFNIIANVCSIVGLFVSLFLASKFNKLSHVGIGKGAIVVNGNKNNLNLDCSVIAASNAAVDCQIINNGEGVWIDEILSQYLNKININHEKFKYHGKIESTLGCLREMFSLSLDEIQYLGHEHDNNKHLFLEVENEAIDRKMGVINNMVHSFVEQFGGDKIYEPQELADAMDEICINVVKFRKFYIEVIQNKINRLHTDAGNISKKK